MSGPSATAQYTASCNPPRRAKRARTTLDLSSPEALSDSPPDSDWVPDRLQQPRILPKPPGPPRDAAKADEQLTKRRGRKPGSGSGMSRSARESMRKQNHSRIEKARRTKINDALAALRVLVPKRTELAVEDVDEPVETKGKKSKAKAKEGEEKEFKLEILVRTVAYMEELVEKVKRLEDGAKPYGRCACGGATRDTDNPEPARGHSLDRAIKRKRVIEDEEEEPKPEEPIVEDMAESSEDELADDEGDARCSVRHGSALSSVTSTPRLPPIASWMPLPPGHVDPSALSLPPSQLPSPPLSVPMPPKTTPYAPPTLTLPPPNLRLTPAALPASAGAPAMSRQTSSSTRDEDDEAASALLQIRTLSPTSPTVPASGFRLGGHKAPVSREIFQVQTPGALLGLARSRVDVEP
jgi:hypothetical protein